MKYNVGKKPKKSKRFIPWAFVSICLIVVGFVVVTWYIRHRYSSNLKPVSSSIQIVYFTVDKGSSTKQIAAKLQSSGLIKSSSAFEWYVRSKELRDKLQAGTYTFTPSLSVNQIVDKMVNGDIAKNLLTIFPEMREADIKKIFSKSGYSDQDIALAFNPASYKGYLAISYLPTGASLEGLIYPDSYEKTDQTSANSIVGLALDGLAKQLTPDLVAAFQKQGLSVYQAITLASIVDKEVSNPADKPLVAQVYLKRLKSGINLDADPTSDYASFLAGLSKTNYQIDSSYNTYKVVGLPPGPIANVTDQALKAVAFPANTDFLYFVAGDDGVTHFSKTLAEHEAATAKYCKKVCGR